MSHQQEMEGLNPVIYSLSLLILSVCLFFFAGTVCLVYDTYHGEFRGEAGVEQQDR